MVPRQYYSYALKNDELINVEKATKGEVYLCPHCGAVMIPKQGTKRRWHFAHKGDTGSCSYESYLHKLAKRRIKECFLSAEHFEILLLSNAICSCPECPVGKSEKCRFPRHIDLKEYYDCCEEEVTVDEYRADLRLTHSSKIERVPVLIEIRVSHECTEEKKKSGHKIIEVGIDSEEDIDRIVRTATISAKIYGESSSSLHNSKDVKNIFYSPTQSEPSEEIPHQKYQRLKYSYWIDLGGCVHFDYNEDGAVRCLMPNTPEIENTQFLIQSDSPIEMDFAFYKLSQYGLGLKYCEMCEHYRSMGRYICYEKARREFERSRGNNHISHPSDVKECSGFVQVNYVDTRRYFEIKYNQECKVTIKRQLLGELKYCS